jgi:hypothetical protein
MIYYYSSIQNNRITVSDGNTVPGAGYGWRSVDHTAFILLISFIIRGDRRSTGALGSCSKRSSTSFLYIIKLFFLLFHIVAFCFPFFSLTFQKGDVSVSVDS